MGELYQDPFSPPVRPDIVQSILYQAIINAGCQVAQRAAPNLSMSYQYGQVDRFAAKGSGTAVSAGTISQITNANVGASGYALKLAGVTITGTGIVYVRYRIEAKDAIMFKNQIASFACKVYHDVGSTINYTIYIRKANAADDFTGVTAIGNSGAIPVASATVFQLKFENVSLGDCSNGLEIEIQGACGAVTTKNFEFGEFQFNKGNAAFSFIPKSFKDELVACYRYYQSSYNYGTYPSDSLDNTSGCYAYARTNSILECWCGSYFNGPMRKAPTTTIYNYFGTPGKVSTPGNANSIGAVVTAPRTQNLGIGEINDSGTSFTVGTIYWFGWTADAEL